MLANLPLCGCYSRYKTKKAIAAFYKRQNQILEDHAEDEAILQLDHDEHQQQHQEERDAKARRDNLLAKFVLGVNCILITANIVAAILSHSMSIISAVVDSSMDITCGAVIWGTVRSIDNTNPKEYPIGRTRLEPLAVLIVSMIMISANVMVIYESTMAIVDHTLNPVVNIETLCILLSGTVIKTILWILCRRQNTVSSRLLAQDQLNDMRTNIVALAGAYCGHRFWKYCDPIGAYLVSGYIIFNWFGTAREQVPLLIGRTATPDFINRISRIAMTHSDKIQAIDMIYAYHHGSNFLVEIHVLMDGNMSLFDTHDISETLQTKVERLPYVERAFVHCDYKLDGDEHLKKFN